eukprot:bmy_19634T0
MKQAFCKTPQKSCKSRGSNLCVHFTNTHVTTQAIRFAYPISHRVSERCHFTGAMGDILSLQWVGGPHRVLFLLHMLKNAKSDDELKGLDIDSLVTEHIQVNKATVSIKLVVRLALHELRLTH